MTVDIFPIFEDGESGDALYQSLGHRALESALAEIPAAVEQARKQGATGVTVEVTL